MGKSINNTLCKMKNDCEKKKKIENISLENLTILLWKITLKRERKERKEKYRYP